jgi:hypothetical protein
MAIAIAFGWGGRRLRGPAQRTLNPEKSKIWSVGIEMLFDKVKLIFVSLHLHTADSGRGQSNFAIYVLKLSY